MPNELDEHLDAAGVTEIDARQRVHAHCVGVKARYDTFLTATDPSELAPLPVAGVLIELQTRESICHASATAYEEDAKANRKTDSNSSSASSSRKNG